MNSTQQEINVGLASRDSRVYGKLQFMLINFRDYNLDMLEDMEATVNHAYWQFYRELDDPAHEGNADLALTFGSDTIKITATKPNAEGQINISWSLENSTIAARSHWDDKGFSTEVSSYQLVARPRDFGKPTKQERIQSWFAIGTVMFIVGLVLMVLLAFPSIIWSGFADWLFGLSLLITAIGGGIALILEPHAR